MTPPAPDASNAAGVGAALKKARTQRGLSLDSVGQKTRVPRKFLEALEAERYDDFPAPVYLRGFLRTYCEFLELDFDPLWAKVQGSKEPAVAHDEHPAPAAPADGAKAKDHAPGRGHAPAAAQKRSTSSRAAAAPGPRLAPLAAVGGVAVLGVVFFLLTSSRQPAAPKPEWTPPPPVTPLYAGKPMALKFVFKARAWIQVSADDKSLFEGWVPAGATQEWSAEKTFRVRTEDPSKIDAEVDGVATPLSGWTRTSAGEYSLDNPH